MRAVTVEGGYRPAYEVLETSDIMHFGWVNEYYYIVEMN